jgi:glycosyltransferase involved in cell wall biosynthesis
MRVLHLAAGNRWTGAAAPAFAEVEALRAAGIEAHFAYAGGYKLEEKLRGVDFAHPVIRKAQNPVAFARTVAALRALVDERRIDIVHAHLTYDHWLAQFIGRGVRVARTFHSRRTLRRDPFTRTLLRRTDIVAVINDTFADAALLRDRKTFFTPPPVDLRQFNDDGPNVRAAYGFTDRTPVIAVIGKVSPGRGFEAAIQTFASYRRSVAGAKLLIIGHGPHQPALADLARELGVANGVVWAGYHEHDLAAHYRAADVLLFTAPGSDEGHRAILEAMASGVTPATLPIAGVSTLVGPALAPRLIASAGEPDSLARTVAAIMEQRNVLKAASVKQAQTFGYDRAAERLQAAYGTTM